MSIKFTPHNLYRHMRCIDVDMYIMKHLDETEDEVYLKVRWWNRNYQGFHDKIDVVCVKKKDIDMWQHLGDQFG